MELDAESNYTPAEKATYEAVSATIGAVGGLVSRMKKS